MGNNSIQEIERSIASQFTLDENSVPHDVMVAAANYLRLQLMRQFDADISEDQLAATRSQLVNVLAQATYTMDAYRKAIFLQNLENKCKDKLKLAKADILTSTTTEREKLSAVISPIELNFIELKKELAIVIRPMQIEHVVEEGFGINSLAQRNGPMVCAAGLIRQQLLSYCTNQEVDSKILENLRSKLIDALIQATHSMSAEHKANFLQNFKVSCLNNIFKSKQMLSDKADYLDIGQSWERELDRVSLDFNELLKDLKAEDERQVADSTAQVLNAPIASIPVQAEKAFINKVQASIKQPEKHKVVLQPTAKSSQSLTLPAPKTGWLDALKPIAKAIVNGLKKLGGLLGIGAAHKAVGAGSMGTIVSSLGGPAHHTAEKFKTHELDFQSGDVIANKNAAQPASGQTENISSSEEFTHDSVDGEEKPENTMYSTPTPG